MEPANNRDDLTRRRALRAALEWLSSDDFEPEARSETFLATLTVWNTYKNLEKRVGYTHPELQQAERSWEETRDALLASGWFKVQQHTVGRPRTLDFSVAEQNSAEGKLRWHFRDRSVRTEKHLERVRGDSQRSNAWVVTVRDAVWRDLLVGTSATAVEGKTRDELVNLLGITKNVANAFVRYLLLNGWRESKVRTRDGRKRVLRQPNHPVHVYRDFT